MRPVFQNKWGVDPWESRGHLPFLDQLIKNIPAGEVPARILFVEPMFGESLLTIRNYFRRLQKKVVIDAVVCNERCLTEAKYMADTVLRLTALDNLPDEVRENYDAIILGTFLNVLPISEIVPFFIQTHEILKSNGFIYATLLNYNSFEHVMENLPNDIPHFIYDSILSLNGGRVFPIPRLVYALKEQFSAERVRVGYWTCAHYFEAITNFEQMVTQILGASSDLHYLLAGDVVVLYVR